MLDCGYVGDAPKISKQTLRDFKDISLTRKLFPVATAIMIFAINVLVKVMKEAVPTAQLLKRQKYQVLDRGYVIDALKIFTQTIKDIKRITKIENSFLVVFVRNYSVMSTDVNNMNELSTPSNNRNHYNTQLLVEI